jgi:predicted transcriptional regulator
MTDQLDATMTMRIPVELKARLRAEADKHWLKPSDIARIAIRDFLDAECGTSEVQPNHEEGTK